MTPEDLAQITAAMAGSIAAAEERISAATAKAIAAAEERTSAAIAKAIATAIATSEQRSGERLERAVEALTANLSEVRQELSIRLDTLNRRFEAQAPIILSLDQRVAALLRQADHLERDNGAMLANDAAQQRAFDALAARVARIERELHPEQQ